MSTILKGISTDHFKIIYNNKLKIKFLFNVKVKDSTSTKQTFDLHLYKDIKGSNIEKAKEYIFALISPECKEEHRFGTPAKKILINPFWLEAIEKCYGVSVELKAANSALVVAGTKANVQLAMEDLKSLEQKLASNGSDSNLDGSNALNWKILKLITKPLKRRHPQFSFSDYSHYNNAVKNHFLQWLLTVERENDDETEGEESIIVVEPQKSEESVIIIDDGTPVPKKKPGTNKRKRSLALVDLTAEEGPSSTSAANDLNDSVIILSFKPADNGVKRGVKRRKDFKEGKNKKPRNKNTLFCLDRSPQPMHRTKEPDLPTQDQSSTPAPQANMSVPQSPVQVNLRPIVIDGSNIARSHGKNGIFSCKGIQLVVDYFRKRGHMDIKVFVPQYMRKRHTPIPITDQHLLEKLFKEDFVVFTPSRTVGKLNIASYDDRYIVDLASKNGGVIVSNDNFRDIMNESPEFFRTIKERLLMYCMVGDFFMPPEDPLGRNGPNLDNFLKFPPGPPPQSKPL